MLLNRGLIGQRINVNSFDADVSYLHRVTKEVPCHKFDAHKPILVIFVGNINEKQSDHTVYFDHDVSTSTNIC